MSAIAVMPYPEELRETPLGELEVQVFQPRGRHVVMGAGGKQEKEVYAEEMAALGMPLYKRKGGGGTVLLGPETIVVTVHAGVTHRFQNLAYFRAVNSGLIDVFRDWVDLPFVTAGISDIAVEGRKVVGTSIFRRRQYLLYQASILVELDLPLMNRVLRHPPRMPDYRADRDHAGFLTCLRELGVTRSIEEMIGDLAARLPMVLPGHLDEVNRATPA